MDLDTLIVTVFCRIDDALPTILNGTRLRERGREPQLSDAEVLTLEVVGEFLGLTQDKHIFEYFQKHWQPFFPALGKLHRTTFARQAANRWRVKERLWQAVLTALEFDSEVSLIDSFPLEVCRFARANRCRRLREISAYGFDEVARQTFFGVRFHLRVCVPGVITAFEFAPANIHELSR